MEGGGLKRRDLLSIYLFLFSITGERRRCFFFSKRERPGAVRDRIRHWVMSGRYINVPVSLLLLLPTKSNYRYISVCSVFPLFYFLIFIYRSILSLDREKRKNCVSRTELLPLLLGYGWGCPIWDLSLSSERET